MKCRLARHTADLAAHIYFYCEVAGLELLGSFRGHDGYDGVFIGKKHADWHLEFTASSEAPEHHFDEDDLLVLYVADEGALQEVKERFAAYGIPAHEPKNPYWRAHGLLYKDPDGYGVVFALMP
jgi:catechol 2,3-dioxygenase-like lactoylglutathione lyase family enzyme